MAIRWQRRCAQLVWGAALACAACLGVAAESRVVAYVANWSMPPVIHVEKLTHINFAFARIDPAGRIGFQYPNAGPTLKSAAGPQEG